MTLREKITDWAAGDRIIVSRMNALVNSARRDITGASPIKVVTTPAGWHISLDDSSSALWWVGQIDFGAQASDYTDCRYYVKKQTTYDATGSDIATFSDDVSGEVSDYTVTNLAEISDDSHFLDDGKQVIVYEVPNTDEDGPGTVYVMSETPERQFMGVIVSATSDMSYDNGTNEVGIRWSYYAKRLDTRKTGGVGYDGTFQTIQPSFLCYNVLGEVTDSDGNAIGNNIDPDNLDYNGDDTFEYRFKPLKANTPVFISKVMASDAGSDAVEYWIVGTGWPLPIDGACT